MRRLRFSAVASVSLLVLVAMLAVCVPLRSFAAVAGHALIGNAAPDFALRATGGVNVRLSEYRGEVVLLTFWGSRCSQCRPQLAALNALQGTYHSAGLVTLGVSVDDDQARARAFALATPTEFPMLLDPAKTVARAYDVDNLPMTLLIDRSGAVRYVHRDYQSGSEALYLQELKALLDE